MSTSSSSAAPSAVSTVLKVGNATMDVPFTPTPGMPGTAFQYFNLHDDDKVEVIQESARLIHEATADGRLLFTAETSTYELAHELRSVYRRKVHVLSKKPRADAKPEDIQRHVTYTPVTSTSPSSLYFPSSLKFPDATAESPMKVTFFDNVVTTGNTIKAAAQLLKKEHIIVEQVIVLFTEGFEPLTTINVEEGFAIPVVAFGHLPLIRSTLSAATAAPSADSCAPVNVQDEFRTEYSLYSDAVIPTTEFGDVQFCVFTSITGRNAIAVVGQSGKLPDDLANTPVLCRVHDACITSECFHSAKCDCRDQLELALDIVGKEGGMVIYLLQEGRGIGLAAKIAAYALQINEGLDTVDANRALGLPDDCRTYVAARDIFRHFNIRKVQLMTNNPNKVEKLQELGVDVVGTRAVVVKPNSVHCAKYMQAKADRMGHRIPSQESFMMEDGVEEDVEGSSSK